MKEKIKQNKNKAAILLSVFFFGLAGWLFAFPSYAEYTEPIYGSWDNQPLPVQTVPNTALDGYAISYKPFLSSGNYQRGILISSGDNPVYCVTFKENNNVRLYLASETTFYTWVYSYNSSQNECTVTDYANTTSFTVNGTTYRERDVGVVGSINNITEYYAPLYETRQLAQEALADIIGNGLPQPAVTPHRFAGSLAPGYVAVFDVGGLEDINIVLGTTLFSGYKYSGYSTTQAAGMTSSMPTSVTLPLSYTSSINWQGSGQKNLVGQYSNFAFSEHVTSTFNSQYYVVVNPLSGSAPTGSALEASSSNRNNNITILIDKVKSYKTFSLTESVNIGDNGWSADTSSNGSTTTGTYDEDTGAWNGVNDQTEQPQDFNDLPVGGGNTPLVSGNNSINDWLQDIANSIKGFFSGAVGAVSTLVGAGSEFINSLRGLYSWLPPAVYSVLTSALILVITIGVIKVFI